MKKVLSLLTLLLAVCSGAWATEETIFSYTVESVPSTQSDGEVSYDATDGTCAFNIITTDNKAVFANVSISSTNTPTYSFGGNDAYVKVTLATGKTFKTGDKISISAVCANNNYASRYLIITTDKTNNAINTTAYANKGGKNTLTATLTAAYNGASELYIKRKDGSNFIGVTITREEASAPKAISFSPGTGDIGAGSKITLTSTGATSIKYQWGTTVVGSEGDWSSATTYDDSHKPEAPAYGSTDNILSVCATNEIGSTYGSATYTPLNVINKIIYSLVSGVGSAEVTTADATVNDGTSLVLTNTAGRIKLTAAAGEKFKSGDVITFSGTIGNSTKAYGVKYGPTTSLGTNLYVAAGEECAVEGELKLASESSELYIGRYDASTTTATSFVISRPALAIPVSTLTDRNYATCVPTKKLDFSAADGITAYIATGLNGASDGVVITPVDVVDAGTPIIVKTDTKGATVNVPVTTAAASDASANLLVAGDGTTAWNGTAGTTYYYLASDLFHEANKGTLQSGKAYLGITTGAARELRFVFADDSQTTGINTVENAKTINGIFNLNGQRVSQPTKGLYIVNGRKVVIK